MNDALERQAIIVQSTKNPGTAALLGCLFGPIGLLYSSVVGAIVMFCINVFVGIFTLGFGLLLSWPVCGVWGYFAASAYNKKLLERKA